MVISSFQLRCCLFGSTEPFFIWRCFKLALNYREFREPYLGFLILGTKMVLDDSLCCVQIKLFMCLLGLGFGHQFLLRLLNLPDVLFYPILKVRRSFYDFRVDFMVRFAHAVQTHVG